MIPHYLTCTWSIGLGASSRQRGASWNASRLTYDSVHSSIIVSSSCGWNTLTRKSSRNDVSVLTAMPESKGTMSLSRWRKEREGGSRMAILKTLDSVRSLWVAAPPLDERSLPVLAPEHPGDFDTRPGTEFCNILLRSCCSSERFLALWSTSARLKRRYERISMN